MASRRRVAIAAFTVVVAIFVAVGIVLTVIPEASGPVELAANIMIVIGISIIIGALIYLASKRSRR